MMADPSPLQAGQLQKDRLKSSTIPNIINLFCMGTSISRERHGKSMAHHPEERILTKMTSQKNFHEACNAFLIVVMRSSFFNDETFKKKTGQIHHQDDAKKRRLAKVGAGKKFCSSLPNKSMSKSIV